MLQQGGSEPDRTRCCAHCRPSPRARGITPHQEDALGQGSMGWEEAELHKCTLSIHRTHLLGNRPPIYSPEQQSTSLCRQPGHTGREGGGGCHRHTGCCRSAPGLPSLPSTLGGSWGRELALLGCFKPLGFLCGAEEGMSHARTKPWGPGDARQPRIEEIFHDKLSQPGHACHLVERPGDSGRDPKPCSPGPEAEAREFPIVANPKPGTPQKSGRGLTVQ